MQPSVKFVLTEYIQLNLIWRTIHRVIDFLLTNEQKINITALRINSESNHYCITYLHSYVMLWKPHCPGVLNRLPSRFSIVYCRACNFAIYLVNISLRSNGKLTALSVPEIIEGQGPAVLAAGA